MIQYKCTTKSIWIKKSTISLGEIRKIIYPDTSAQKQKTKLHQV